MYRIRIEGEAGLLVLQVQVQKASTMYDNYRHEPEWRDAQVTDIPLGQIFPTPIPEGYVIISKETARSFGMGEPL